MSTLTPETIATVKATIPFLAENSVKLTSCFYERLFRDNPETKPYFNAAHQESGAQQGALAGAICAFARNIETPENLAEAVSRIGHKHVSLGVLPEHYPIVGKNLLAAIDDLLDPAPPEILEAWGEAYGFLADVLIGAEGEMYHSQQDIEGGWEGFREMEVFRRDHESQWITSFYLRPKDGGRLPAFRPGQYLTVRIPDGAGSTTMRNYSLSGSPAWDHYRISVKREVPNHADTPEGFVSSFLHTRLGLGDILEIRPPSGDFFLGDHSPETPILLLSGGVGITPLLSMLHAIKEQAVTFLHGAISSEIHALRDEVNELEEENDNVKVHFRYSQPTREDERKKPHHSTGLFSVDFLRDFIAPETEIYFCGPKVMMLHVNRALAEIGHPADQIHFEFFGPSEELAR